MMSEPTVCSGCGKTYGASWGDVSGICPKCQNSSKPKTLTPNEYQRLASRTECDQLAAAKRRTEADHMTKFRYNPQYECEEGLPKSEYLLATRLTHCALGLTSDAGEVAANIERWIHYGKPFDPTNLIEELGDCLWYIALGCNALGVSMEDVMKTNIAKLRKRYPQNYSDQLAAEENRDREAERQAMEYLDGKRPIVAGKTAEIVLQMAKANQDSEQERRILELCGEDKDRIKAAEEIGVTPAVMSQIKPKFTLCAKCRSPLVKHAPKNCPDCGEPTNADI